MDSPNPPGRTPATLNLTPTDDELVEMLEAMVEARVYSTRFFNLQRQGRVGTNAPVDGNEALTVGLASALDPTVDWIAPQYREQVCLGRFGESLLDAHVLYQMGHPAGGFYPPGVNVLPVQISLAAQIPHAVGLAWGLKIRDIAGCVAVFFGDGASSEGDFYEAANMAGVLRAPVIFVLVNNGWAISTPLDKQTAADSFSDKAAAFGFPGVRVDGRDPVAMREVSAAARARAVRGDGPTLIEAVTYRLAPHTTADDPTRYVPSEELEEAKTLDPIVVFAQQLADAGLWDDERHRAAEQAADERMERAVQAAEANRARPDAMFDHVYAEPTVRMRRQRDEMRAHLGLEPSGTDNAGVR